ncbi:hypothetical protein ACFSO0_10855 [Brevibacillus sp. GCM10020057]|uniref:hypothetical protein n=1 Tax=Brevibacillus sp. GCM10020057 TaxID=3317327 RepID=UPI0036373AD8
MKDEHIEYTEPLTGTLAEAAGEAAQSCSQLGVPFSPLEQTWQVNPPANKAEEAQDL